MTTACSSLIPSSSVASCSDLSLSSSWVQSGSSDDPLLKQNGDRFVLVPELQHHEIRRSYKEHSTESMWVCEHFKWAIIQEEAKKWSTEFNTVERHFLLDALDSVAILCNTDHIAKILKEVQLGEVRYFYSFQITKRQIQYEACETLLHVYSQVSGDCGYVRRPFSTPVVYSKLNDSFLPISDRLVAGVCVDYFGMHHLIRERLVVKNQTELPETMSLLSAILEDRQRDSNFGCRMYSMIQNKMEKGDLLKLVTFMEDQMGIHISRELGTCMRKTLYTSFGLEWDTKKNPVANYHTEVMSPYELHMYNKGRYQSFGCPGDDIYSRGGPRQEVTPFSMNEEF